MRAEIVTPLRFLEKKVFRTLFLGGTIDNGNSVDWQAQAIRDLGDHFDAIYNPRRSDWNPEAGPGGVRDQIDWEMTHLDSCTHILLNFEKGSLSPISLLELGLYARSRKIVVRVDPEFWRLINVEEVTDKYQIPTFYHMYLAVQYLKRESPPFV